MLRPIAFYYVLLSARTRRNSRRYLERIYDDVGFWLIYRHVLTFAECTLDRMFHVAGRSDLFEIDRSGSANIAEFGDGKTGALLLGAHLGSFEMLRWAGRNAHKRVNILVHLENAKKITAFLRTVAPDFDGRVIPVEPNRPQFILRVAECINAGEFVALLGDRTGLGEASVAVEFLGSSARFPTGPYALAAALRCPVLLTLALYKPPNNYSLFCERFATAQEVAAARRDPEALRKLAQRYASRLEHFCELAPLNWFNFYDFWA